MSTSTLQITCGNCGGKHGSVNAVRNCYDTGDRTSSPTAGVYGPYGTAQGPSPRSSAAPTAMATQKQIDFLKSLCSERPEWAADQNLTDNIIEHLLKIDASNAIKLALAQPKETAATKAYDGFPDVPAGRYAIDIDDTVKFYKVDRPTEGKWAGRTFVKVQASDELHQIRTKKTINAVMNAIVDQGIEVSLARYGQLLGDCGVCGRTLTDELSRSIGIGPVCRNK